MDRQEDEDEDKLGELHVVPGLNEWYCGLPSNGSSSSSNHSIHNNDHVHKNNIKPSLDLDDHSLTNHGETRNLVQCTSPKGCNTSNSEISGDGTDLDEVGDLLRRFDNFFREKVDREMQTIGEFMHEMLSEQQIHLQQILGHSSLHTKCFQSLEESGPTEAGDNVFSKNVLSEPFEEIEMQLSGGECAAVTQQVERSVTSDILLELLSLSCDLSAMLTQSKYL